MSSIDWNQFVPQAELGCRLAAPGRKCPHANTHRGIREVVPEGRGYRYNPDSAQKFSNCHQGRFELGINKIEADEVFFTALFFDEAKPVRIGPGGGPHGFIVRGSIAGLERRIHELYKTWKTIIEDTVFKESSLSPLTQLILKYTLGFEEVGVREISSCLRQIIFKVTCLSKPGLSPNQMVALKELKWGMLPYRLVEGNLLKYFRATQDMMVSTNWNTKPINFKWNMPLFGCHSIFFDMPTASFHWEVDEPKFDSLVEEWLLPFKKQVETTAVVKPKAVEIQSTPAPSSAPSGKELDATLSPPLAKEPELDKTEERCEDCSNPIWFFWRILCDLWERVSACLFKGVG